MFIYTSVLRLIPCFTLYFREYSSKHAYIYHFVDNIPVFLKNLQVYKGIDPILLDNVLLLTIMKLSSQTYDVNTYYVLTEIRHKKHRYLL